MVTCKLCAFADEADPSVTGQIRALNENNIGLLEMRGVNGKNVTKLTPSEAKEVKRELNAGGIKVWSIGSPAGKSPITDPFENEREQFKRLLEIADIMNAARIRIFSFYGTGGKSEYRDEVLLRLSQFSELANGSGVTLCHENEKGIWGDTADRCVAIHQALPEIAAVFDPANFVQCQENTLRAWEMLSPYVCYGHVKDARTDGTVVPPGEGFGHLAEYLPRFFAKGCEVLTLEPHLTKFVGRGSLEETVDDGTFREWKFASGRDAFDFAVQSLRNILSRI